MGSKYGFDPAKLGGAKQPQSKYGFDPSQLEASAPTPEASAEHGAVEVAPSADPVTLFLRGERDTPTVKRGPLRLAKPDELDSAVIGMKANDTDRLAAAHEKFPDARIYEDAGGIITVAHPDGRIMNFERPDYGHAIAGAVRGAAGLDREIRGGEGFDDQGNPVSSGEDPIVRDAVQSNAAAALPGIALRSAANAATAALPGGILLRALYGAAANGSVPLIQRNINEATAGGSTQTQNEVQHEAGKDAALGAAGTLVPGAVLGLAKAPAALVNPLLRRLLGLSITRPVLPSAAGALGSLEAQALNE